MITTISNMPVKLRLRNGKCTYQTNYVSIIGGIVDLSDVSTSSTTTTTHNNNLISGNMNVNGSGNTSGATTKCGGAIHSICGWDHVHAFNPIVEFI
jgi:hypothetical protein